MEFIRLFLAVQNLSDLLCEDEIDDLPAGPKMALKDLLKLFEELKEEAYR